MPFTTYCFRKVRVSCNLARLSNVLKLRVPGDLSEERNAVLAGALWLNPH